MARASCCIACVRVVCEHKDIKGRQDLKWTHRPEIAPYPVQLEDAILAVLVIPPSGTSCQCLSKRWEQSHITTTRIFPDWSTIQYRMYSSQSGYGFEGLVCEFVNESLRNIAWLVEHCLMRVQSRFSKSWSLNYWNCLGTSSTQNLTIRCSAWLPGLLLPWKIWGMIRNDSFILCLENLNQFWGAHISDAPHVRYTSQFQAWMFHDVWQILKIQRVGMLLHTIYCEACCIPQR